MPQLSKTVLRAGLLSCDYSNGAIRRVRVGNSPVLLHIYFAVRDRNWNTIPLQVVGEQIESNADRFRVQLKCAHQQDDIDFRWRGVITGTADGSITFSAEGEAYSEFLRNRIGICILHGVGANGHAECTLIHSDGSRENSRFPRSVFPHQPFLDLSGMVYRVGAGRTAELHFSGDVFETEDQRNWSDGSFKTYSTPLRIPYPKQLKPGDRVSQSVRLRVDGSAEPVEDDSDGVRLHFDAGSERPMPEIGVVWAHGDVPRGASYLRVSSVNGVPDLPLEFAATIANETELGDLRGQGQRIKRLLVFDLETFVTPSELVRAARKMFGDIAIGGGSNKHFAEINRNRDVAASCDFVSWPIDPQAHAIDIETAVENLEGQAPQLQTAEEFTAKPLHISPLLVPELPIADGWTAISVANLAEAARSITISRWLPALEELFGARTIARCVSNKPDLVQAAVTDGKVAWIANFTPERQEGVLDGKQFSVDAYGLARLELNA